MKTLKKIYYVPGMISAILIPLVYWYLGNRELQRPIPHVMDIGLIPKFNPNVPINQQNSFELVRNLNYQKIIVGPNLAKENSSYFVSEIKNLQKRNINKTGIEFVLNVNNTYGDFASILNDMAIAKHDTYEIDLDKTGHLFAITNYKNPYKIERNYDGVYNDTVDNYYQESNYFSGYKKFKFQLTQLPKQAFYIIFGFLILLNMSILSLIKRNF